MTPKGRSTDHESASHVLRLVLAAVEAALRSEPAVDVRLDVLHEWTDTRQLLAAISIATLDQLGDGIGACPADSTGDLAAALLDRAVQFHLSPRSAVHAAACRLEIVARSDRSRLTAELRSSRADDGGVESLIDGAIALLAAVVELSARRRGQAPEQLAERLCLAASSRVRAFTPSVPQATA